VSIIVQYLAGDGPPEAPEAKQGEHSAKESRRPQPAAKRPQRRRPHLNTDIAKKYGASLMASPKRLRTCDTVTQGYFSDLAR